ncbi:hypothetical protein ACI3ET_05850 [Ornithinimicrobium sp. LYQ121]|uniref:hypothetical protein n=1 Tax=Ornithinimicrobium sp. LYQ121 TaxID=3378801 RepID=UPI003855576C
MSPRPALTVRPIRFTDDIPGWQTVLGALGAVLLSEHPGWLVYQLGAGRLAVHAASGAGSGSGSPAGTTVLGFETGMPLAEAVASAAERGVPVELGGTGHGEAGIVTAADGTSFTLDTPTPNPEDLEATRPELAVLPIWHAPRPRVALDVLDGLGMRRRVIEEDGSWVDLTARSGGLHGVHRREEAGAELSFELEGDVAQLQEALAEVGVDAQLHEESFGRSLRIADPDGRAPVWVVERQPDLYSYALSEL